MRLPSVLRGVAQARSASSTRTASRAARQARTALDGLLLDLGVDRQDGAGDVGRQRVRLGGREAVDADDDVLAGLDPAPALGVRGDQGALHVAALDGGDGATQRLHPVDLGAHLLDQLGDLGLDDHRAREQVLVLEQVGLEGEHLLQAQRPLLVPRAGQAERLVPGRQLHRAGPGVLGQRHPEHLEHDALDVVLGLRLGEPERVDLHAVAEPALRRVRHAVALEQQLVPQPREGAHLAQLLHEAHPGVDEEADPRADLAEALRRHLPGRLHRVEDGDRRAQRVRDLLDGRRARLLQVVAADVDRVPRRASR
jgi:hypothetical protein